MQPGPNVPEAGFGGCGAVRGFDRDLVFGLRVPVVTTPSWHRTCSMRPVDDRKLTAVDILGERAFGQGYRRHNCSTQIKVTKLFKIMIIIFYNKFSYLSVNT